MTRPKRWTQEELVNALYSLKCEAIIELIEVNLVRLAKA